MESTEIKKYNGPELKELSSHLNYVILGDQPTQLAIISYLLSGLKEEKLMKVLRENK